MSDFIKTLLRKNSLRKQCQDVSVADIEKVIADLNDILVERKEDEARLAAEESKRIEKIEQIRLAMKEAGIDLSDLSDVVEASPKKTVKAKYYIVDDEGARHEWSGRGRTPVVFAEYMQARGIGKDQLPSAE
ncbi:DNA-binding protein H-NS [Nitrincola lacisaponensis]|uniref:DNA-binding protein n=1 Tax=Nitrincola lacisaponensis TaxID=267850 RepID=A0A063Y596_9GAMM|nr:H-NS family nucleoid-associated regulatory protein [Nitrincola lacisaponensis]KDE40854.1 DNA-binding protein H-NS [Nitrincola lacisaponensis]